MNHLLSIDLKKTEPFIKEKNNEQELENIARIDKELICSGENNWTGWEILPEQKELLTEREQIKEIAAEIQDSNSYLVVIGIGGSYLGAKAVISAFQPLFQPSKIIFAGYHLDGHYLEQSLEFLKDKDFYINIISKSGTTLEPAISFRMFKQLLEKKYSPEEARKRIICTTDSQKGVLKKIADDNQYRTFVIPHNIGGRFSVLTPVGLLPIAAAGLSIEQLIQGASISRKRSLNKDFHNNPVYEYSLMRHQLYQSEKKIEILSTFHPQLSTFAEWWKQLFGESEGKENKGLFPASCVFSTDLHSLGQWIQEGPRIIFETFLNIQQDHNILFPEDKKNQDKLNYLAGKNLHEINQKAFEGTVKAHFDGEVPIIQIHLQKLNEQAIGELIYFFEKTTAINGFLLNVDPFNQPGVEAYKKNMFHLLGKTE